MPLARTHTGEDGATALHVAAAWPGARARLHEAAALLAGGVSPNVRARDGTTPLVLAAQVCCVLLRMI